MFIKHCKVRLSTNAPELTEADKQKFVNPEFQRHKLNQKEYRKPRVFSNESDMTHSFNFTRQLGVHSQHLDRMTNTHIDQTYNMSIREMREHVRNELMIKKAHETLLLQQRQAVARSELAKHKKSVGLDREQPSLFSPNGGTTRFDLLQG